MHEVAARRCPTALTPSFPRYSSRYEIRTGRQTDAFFLLMQHDPRHVAADGGKSVRYEDAHGGEEGGPKVRDPPTLSTGFLPAAAPHRSHPFHFPLANSTT